MNAQVFVQKLRWEVLSAVDTLKSPPQPAIFILFFSQKSTELFEEFLVLIQVLLDYCRHLLVILEVFELRLIEFEDVSTEIQIIIQLIETEVGVLEEKAEDGCVTDLALLVCFPHGGQCIPGYEFNVFYLLHVAIFDVPDGISHNGPLSSQQFLSQLLVATGHFGKDCLLGVAGITWLGLFVDCTEKDLCLLFLKHLFGRLFVSMS